MAGPATPVVAAYYVFVQVAGTAGGIYIRKKGKEAAVKLAAKLGGRVYKDGTQRVLGFLKSKKHKAVTEGSKIVKDLLNKKKTVSQKIGEKVSSVKDKITNVFKKKKPKEKKEPKLNVNKTPSKKKITSGDPKLSTKPKKGGVPKTKKPKKGDTIIRKGKKLIWTGSKFVAWSVGIGAALKAGEKILGSMKTDADNTQIKWQLDGVVYKNYEDYNKALTKKKADKNKKVTKTQDGKIKIINTKTDGQPKPKTKVINTKSGQKDRVIKKDDVKTVNNKKSTNNNATSKKTSGATTSSSSGSSGTSKSWKDYKTISAAQRAGSPFFNRDGIKKAAVTAEQLTKSGLTLQRYMNIKLGKTARKK